MPAARGHWPVSAFVWPATICARSGKTRVGSGVAAFSPGDGDISVPSSVTCAAVPNWRNSGPLVLRLLFSGVPPPAPSSFCSQLYVSGSPSGSVALPVRLNGVRTGIR